MRARLTKQQIQMLIDGKCLTAGAVKYRIAPDADDIKEGLQRCLDTNATVFIDTKTKEILVDDEA